MVREPITLESGTTAELDFEMTVGSTATEVTINAGVPVIQTGTSTIQYGLDLKQIDDFRSPIKAPFRFCSCFRACRAFPARSKPRSLPA